MNKFKKDLDQEEMAKEEKLTLSKNLISVEFLQVIDAWNLTKWEDYKDFSRLGRRTKLNENQRKEIWNVCEHRNSTNKAIVIFNGKAGNDGHSPGRCGITKRV